jgi:hypothetical protein
VKVWPPAVMVPVRGVVLVFAATVNETVPLPAPLAPPLTVIHVTPLVAVQAHPALAVIENDPLAPPAGTDRDEGAIE